MTHDLRFLNKREDFLPEWQRARHETVELIERAIRTAYRSSNPAKKYCGECGKER